ncbi:COP9 signalosome complex subunit 8 [Lepeophtheirus salmonis]|nr:COP9 signalosome complex subunit 8-like [Lepeophtheirus salmonis]
MKDIEQSEGLEDLSNLRKELETTELDAPNGRPGSDVYAKLLAVYLQQNDLCSAKFLWKRIPEENKAENQELEKIWNVGKALWNRDQPGTFRGLLNTDWSENVKSLMLNVTETARKRHVDLVSSAYSSISISDFSHYVGLPEEEAMRLAQSQEDWKIDDNCRIILPARKKPPPLKSIPSEVQISQLTDYISFLEK